MTHEGEGQQLDELGRCALHPAMQLQHRATSGEWRELLSECPLCASGLPATLTGRIMKPSVPASMTRTSFKHKEDENAGETGGHAISTREYFAATAGQDELHGLQPTTLHYDVHRHDDAGDPHDRPNSYNTTSTTKLLLLEDGNNDSRKGRGLQHDSKNVQCQSFNNKQRQTAQQEVYGSENHFSTLLQHSMPEPSSHNHSAADPPHQHRREDTSIELRKRPDPKVASDFEHIHQMNMFHHEQERANYFPPPAHAFASRPLLSLPSDPPRLWSKEQHIVLNPSLSSNHQKPDSPSDKSTPKVMEQDEVSVMTMSSVTQQMHTKLHIQRQRKRRERQKQTLEQVKSDDESSTTYSDSDDDNGRAPSVYSTALASKASDICETKSASTKSLAQLDEGKINTCDYDERGWCRRHPTTVHLRKKNMFRSTWQVLLSHCPECCLDEIKRVRDERGKQTSKKGTRIRSSANVSSSRSESGETSGSFASGSSRGERSDGGDKKTSRRKHDKKKSIKPKNNPPITQLNLRSSKSRGHSLDQYDDTQSIGTASTVTISSFTQSTGGRLQSSINLLPGNTSSDTNDGGGKYNNNMIVQHGSDNDYEGGGIDVTAHVTRMPYIDKNGSHGWYTGQVDSSTGTPHGIGTMKYATGEVCSSEWNYGTRIPPTKIQEEPFSFGGEDGYIFPIHKSHHSFSYNSPMSGRSYLATLEEDGTSSDYEYADGPVPQQQQHQEQSTVVCGMSWIDQYGNTGAYTGEVNYSNIPHGLGSVRYDCGDVSEGMWVNGEIVGNDMNSEMH